MCVTKNEHFAQLSQIQFLSGSNFFFLNNATRNVRYELHVQAKKIVHLIFLKIFCKEYGKKGKKYGKSDEKIRKKYNNVRKKYVKSKGSHRQRKVQFFLTLFKRPLPPPLLFEHLSYFAGGDF